jgi:hypothetical protein
MIPIRDLFEAHLTVANLQRSMSRCGLHCDVTLLQVMVDGCCRRFLAKLDYAV